jgi:hypothetical protein
MAASDQPVTQPSIGRTEEGTGHSCCRAIVAATLIRGWDYPNVGYDQCQRSHESERLRRSHRLHAARGEGGTVLDLEQTLITAPLWVPPLGSRGLSAVLLDPR